MSIFSGYPTVTTQSYFNAVVLAQSAEIPDPEYSRYGLICASDLKLYPELVSLLCSPTITAAVTLQDHDLDDRATLMIERPSKLNPKAKSKQNHDENIE